jgi:hypothetical protein
MLQTILSRPTLITWEGDILCVIIQWLKYHQDDEYRRSQSRILGLMEKCVRFQHLNVNTFLSMVQPLGWIEASVLLKFVMKNR